MHQEAFDYVKATVATRDLTGLRVLEIGSYYINGTVRPLFDGAAFYLGIDERSGPGVDVEGTARLFALEDAPGDVQIVPARLPTEVEAVLLRRIVQEMRENEGIIIAPEHTFSFSRHAGSFDIVVTCETLEHANPPEDVTACAWRALRPGGLLILTAAGPDRAPHGCNGGGVSDTETYTPIDDAYLAALLIDWEDVRISYHSSHGQARGDIYATAIKPGGGE